MSIFITDIDCQFSYGVCVWFWNQGNSGLRMHQDVFLLFCFMEEFVKDWCQFLFKCWVEFNYFSLFFLFSLISVFIVISFILFSLDLFCSFSGYFTWKFSLLIFIFVVYAFLVLSITFSQVWLLPNFIVSLYFYFYSVSWIY